MSRSRRKLSRQATVWGALPSTCSKTAAVGSASASASSRLAQHRQVVERQRNVGMVRPKKLLLEHQGPAIQPLGLRGVAPRVVQRGQVVQVDSDLVMLGAVDPLEDRQRPVVKRLRVVVLALPVQERRQGSQVRGHVGVVGAQRLLPDRHGATSERLALA